MTGVRVIEGDPTLPPGHARVHASEEAREIAERGTILRVRVGSGVHGTSVSGQDGRDEMGICLEPPRLVTGVAEVPAGTEADGRTVPFEQYERHTVWDEPGGLADRSGAGDLDVIVHSARTWCRLALGGNPAVLLPLFVPDDEVVIRTAAGAELVANADRFVSRHVGERLLGHLNSQRAAMTGETGAHTTRPQPVEVHGYDTGYAMRALRLGVQGVELLGTGRITLPIPEPWSTYLGAVHRGEVELDEVVAAIDEVAGELVRLTVAPGVPDRPDADWVDAWLHRAHLEFWAAG
ncbi:DNA polymerase beta superfamily protein [Jatrophihabitans sp. YIM 134969]